MDFVDRDPGRFCGCSRRSAARKSKEANGDAVRARETVVEEPYAGEAHDAVVGVGPLPTPGLPCTQSPIEIVWSPAACGLT